MSSPIHNSRGVLFRLRTVGEEFPLESTMSGEESLESLTQYSGCFFSQSFQDNPHCDVMQEIDPFPNSRGKTDVEQGHLHGSPTFPACKMFNPFALAREQDLEIQYSPDPLHRAFSAFSVPAYRPQPGVVSDSKSVRTPPSRSLKHAASTRTFVHRGEDREGAEIHGNTDCARSALLEVATFEETDSP